jgi:hypothetical protein
VGGLLLIKSLFCDREPCAHRHNPVGSLLPKAKATLENIAKYNFNFFNIALLLILIILYNIKGVKPKVL